MLNQEEGRVVKIYKIAWGAIMNKNLLSLILKAVALGMGVSAFVLSILGSIEVNHAINLLSIGVVSLAMLHFQGK